MQLLSQPQRQRARGRMCVPGTAVGPLLVGPLLCINMAVLLLRAYSCALETRYYVRICICLR